MVIVAIVFMSTFAFPSFVNPMNPICNGYNIRTYTVMNFVCIRMYLHMYVRMSVYCFSPELELYKYFLYLEPIKRDYSVMFLILSVICHISFLSCLQYHLLNE